MRAPRPGGLLLVWVLAAASSSAALAQESTRWPGGVAADVVGSAEAFAEGDGVDAAGALDLLAGWQPAPGTLISGRPMLQRSLEGEWTLEVLQLAVRHDIDGPVRIRIEGGWLPSPIGLAPLESRASENPMVAPITAYTAWLPPFEVGTPIVQLSSPLYPLAVQATASTETWDARVAVLESSPVRVRPLMGEPRQPRAPQLAVGGGVTPQIGLRIGTSLAYGRYARADEVAESHRGDRSALIVGVDGDYSVRHTRVYGEWIRTALDRASDTTVATSSTVTVVQTLSPRWYFAGRGQHLTTSNLLQTPAGDPYHQHGHEHASAESAEYGYESGVASPAAPLMSSGAVDVGAADALSLETTLGYRVSPWVTLKGGYLGHRAYGEDGLEHYLTVAIVWTGRWQ